MNINETSVQPGVCCNKDMEGLEAIPSLRNSLTQLLLRKTKYTLLIYAATVLFLSCLKENSVYSNGNLSLVSIWLIPSLGVRGVISSTHSLLLFRTKSLPHNKPSSVSPQVHGGHLAAAASPSQLLSTHACPGLAVSLLWLCSCVHPDV